MKNFTKLVFYLAFMFMAIPGMVAQIFIIEAMDSGVPSGWTSSGYSSSSLTPCEGSAGVRDNLWSSSTTGYVETPTQTSNGTDITVSYEWQATPYTTNPVGFTTIVDYTIDGGVTYTQIGTYSATATTACTPFNATILGADVPVGSSFNLRITANWDSGDSYHYVDNVSITQVASTPPNCDAALTSDLTDFPIDGTLTWSSASGIPTGYRISIGSSAGGTDIANNVDVMAATSYTPMGLMNSTTYYVTIIPYNDNGDAMGCTEQTFETVPPPPANDECTGAVMVSVENDVCSTWNPGSNVSATTSPEAFGGTCGGFTKGGDVWFQSTVPATGVVILNRQNVSGISTLVAEVYTGSCGSLTYQGCADFTYPATFSSLPAGDLFLRFWDYSNNDEGTFEFCLTTPSCVEATATTTVDASSCPTISIDLDLTNLGSASAVNITNDINGAQHLGVSALQVYNLAGFSPGDGTVTITVADAANADCFETFVVNIPTGCPPANDNCSGAETLVCGAAALSGTTENTTPPDDPVGCASDYGVWYTFTGTGGEVTLTSTAGSGYDHELDIFSTDSDCDGSFTTVLCDDGSGSGGTETHTFSTDAGVIYYVYVAHYSTSSSSTGTFDIALSCACSETPEATGTLGGTCGAGTYTIEVDLTSLGGASAVNITNDVNGSSEMSVSALQTYSLTGFSPGDGTVTVTVADANDSECNTTFTVAVPSECPPACGGKFYDTGGATGDYGSGENESWTICPDNPGDFVTVTFNTFEVEGFNTNNCWDRLRIFDGNSASAPEIGPGAGYCYESPTDGTNYPGIVLGTPITSTDASGCLHFTFTSDGSGQRDGWDADVTCGPASSTCGNDAVILAPAPQTDLTPQCMEGGWLYYGDGTSTYFAIEPFPAGGNTNAFTANVDIFLGAAQQNTAAVCNGAPIDAHFEMGRAWNVDVLTGSIGGTVNCRFYYDLAETTALATEVATFEAANSACTYTSSAGMVWFKNTGAPYAHYSYDATQTVLATTPGVSGGGINYQEFPVTGFSGGSAGITSLPLTVLPVELASFTGKTMSNTNMLEWVTASEENTEWHVIERSKDGRSDWTEVGRTEAKGFSNELISYQLEDTKPMAKSYYRLRSVDFDGHVDLSNVIYLERKIEQFDIVKVYPVPTSKLLNIDFETVEDQQVQISMTDMLGKVITTRPVGAVAGINTATLDLGNLANGVYFVTINNGQNKITKRVVKN